MLRIVRRGDRHDARDLTVSIRFEGDFATAYLEGRPDGIIPGETLKTFVYKIVREHAGAEIEVLGLALVPARARRRTGRSAACGSRLPSSRGRRMDVGAKPQGQAFLLGGPEQRTVAITSNGNQTAVVSGIDNSMLMRTSGFLPRRVDAARRRWPRGCRAGAARRRAVGEVDLRERRCDVRPVSARRAERR